MSFKNIITLHLMLCFSIFCFSQKNGKAYYTKKSTHKFKLSKELDNDTNTKSSFESVNYSIEDMEFLLTFNDSLATYIEIKKLEVNENSTAVQFAKVFSGYKGPYYYNFNTKKSTRKQGRYLIEKKLSDFDWVLTKEKKIIDDLICYKATTSLKLQGRSGELIRPIIAWYTIDINLSVGPDGFGGLYLD